MSPEERKRFYDEKVAKEYAEGSALNRASIFKLDDAIDPADTRRWITALAGSIRASAPRSGKKRSLIDDF